MIPVATPYTLHQRRQAMKGFRCRSRRYRVIAYNDRGYPPSSVPDDPAAYSEEQSVADLLGLMDALAIPQAHIGGLSMGGAITLKFGIAHPDRCRSLTIAGAGS